MAMQEVMDPIPQEEQEATGERAPMEVMAALE